jgi:diaminohydroxyphosphoribosylaminopyrimidine deaminase/5-amino-6-(5-phosphoribosylamino)uracil reductase
VLKGIGRPNVYSNKLTTLAQMVKGQTGINPPVGAVVVNNGRIVGLGAHLKVHGSSEI